MVDTLNRINSKLSSKLSSNVTSTLEDYFAMLGEEIPSDVFQMVIGQVEKPMVEFVLSKTDHNQSKTAKILGINRNTLRKKIQLYKITK